MRLFNVLLLGFLLSTVAFAGRTGVEERIHICKSSADSKLFGKNQKYRAHVTVDKEIKLTRLSDKKSLVAKSEVASYLFEDVSGFFKDHKSHSGYLDDIANNEMSISIQKAPGRYDSEKMSCQLVRVISELDPLSSTEEALIKIGDQAAEEKLANGGYDWEKFDLKKFDVEVEKTRFNKRRWKGCTWDIYEGKAEGLKAIKDEADDAEVAKMLRALDKEVGIKEIISLISDSDVSCSNRFFWIYTDDGYKLSLEYSQGD